MAPPFLQSRQRPDRRAVARYLCQGIGLAWVVVAISAYPVSQARRENEARLTVKRLGGRYNVEPNSAVDSLPKWMIDSCGGENLYAVRSINFSHCDVGDDDLEVLLQFANLEQVNLCGCPRVTHAGVALLRRLPRLKLVWLDGMSVEEAGRQLTGEPIAAAPP